MALMSGGDRIACWPEGPLTSYLIANGASRCIAWT